jgi:hypothetical protein
VFPQYEVCADESTAFEQRCLAAVHELASVRCEAGLDVSDVPLADAAACIETHLSGAGQGTGSMRHVLYLVLPYLRSGVRDRLVPVSIGPGAGGRPVCRTQAASVVSTDCPALMSACLVQQGARCPGGRARSELRQASTGRSMAVAATGDWLLGGMPAELPAAHRQFEFVPGPRNRVYQLVTAHGTCLMHVQTQGRADYILHRPCQSRPDQLFTLPRTGSAYQLKTLERELCIASSPGDPYLSLVSCNAGDSNQLFVLQ